MTLPMWVLILFSVLATIGAGGVLLLTGAAYLLNDSLKKDVMQ